MPETTRITERGQSEDPLNDLLYGATGQGAATLEPDERQSRTSKPGTRFKGSGEDAETSATRRELMVKFRRLQKQQS